MDKLSNYYLEILKLLAVGEKDTRDLMILNYKSTVIDIKKVLRDYLNRYEDLTFQQWLQVDRLKSLLNQINSVLDNLYTTNESLIINHSEKSYNTAYNGLFYELEVEKGIILNFTKINTDYVKKAIQMPIEGLKLSERLYDKNLYNLKLKTKGAITKGIIDGSGYVKIAKDISDIGVADFKQSLRIAVTEGGRLKSLAREDSYNEASKKGVNLQKKWVATLDKKTRTDHQQLDGQIVGVDEEFHIHGYSAPQPRLFGVAKEDIGCRCDTITIVEGISPELRRDNETKQIIKYDNYEDWYKNKYGDTVFKGGYAYTKDGIMKATDDWKGEHKSLPRKYKPHAVVETSKDFGNGFVQIDRTIYDKEGMMYKQIHSGNHNRPKQHKLGNHGEHVHIYKWNEDGSREDRSPRELSKKDRTEHSDILGDD